MLFACSRGIFSPRTHQTISFFLTASIALNVLHTNNDPSPQNRGPVLARVHSPKQIRKSEIELDNGVTIRCCPCSQVSIRGFRVMAAILDEIGFWRNEITAVNPAEDVLNALRPAMSTFPNHKLIKISTPRRKDCVLWRDYQQRDQLDFLVWQMPTAEMNPRISSEF